MVWCSLLHRSRMGCTSPVQPPTHVDFTQSPNYGTQGHPVSLIPPRAGDKG